MILMTNVMKSKKRIRKERPLSVKQEKFCNKYVECGNASEAYRFAYSCKKMKPATINVKASELLHSGKVAVRVEDLRKVLGSKSDITKEMVLDEYAKIAFSSIAHYHNTWIVREEFDKLTDRQKAAIKSIQTRVRKAGLTKAVMGDKEVLLPIEIEEVKIELYDKLRALDGITKMLGLDAPKKHELTGKDGKDLSAPVSVAISSLTPEERDVLRKIGERRLNDKGN